MAVTVRVAVTLVTRPVAVVSVSVGVSDLAVWVIAAAVVFVAVTISVTVACRRSLPRCLLAPSCRLLFFWFFVVVAGVTESWALIHLVLTTNISQSGNKPMHADWRACGTTLSLLLIKTGRFYLVDKRWPEAGKPPASNQQTVEHITERPWRIPLTIRKQNIKRSREHRDLRDRVFAKAPGA